MSLVCVQAWDNGVTQYTRSQGHMKLVEQLMIDYTQRLQQPLTPEHIQVTVGATGALYEASMALLDEGDEVVLVEPFYDSYPGNAHLAGARTVHVPLTPSRSSTPSAADWRLDVNEAMRNPLQPVRKPESPGNHNFA